MTSIPPPRPGARFLSAVLACAIGRPAVLEASDGDPEDDRAARQTTVRLSGLAAAAFGGLAVYLALEADTSRDGAATLLTVGAVVSLALAVASLGAGAYVILDASEGSSPTAESSGTFDFSVPRSVIHDVWIMEHRAAKDGVSEIEASSREVPP